MYAFFALAALNLAACATPTPRDEDRRLAPLAFALSWPLSDLRMRADQGEAIPEYAMSVFYRYGRGGLMADEAKAADFRARATSVRGSISVATYQRGRGELPGRIEGGEVGLHDLPPEIAEMNDRCAAALAAERETAEAIKLCGGQETFRRLLAYWRNRP
ncbi:MAG: hypothetical protein J7515_12475 [Caulobacter sp.]|nr:hypothetical protein [Caulobacter sp.]